MTIRRFTGLGIVTALAFALPSCRPDKIETTGSGTQSQGFGTDNQRPSVGRPRPAAEAPESGVTAPVGGNGQTGNAVPGES